LEKREDHVRGSSHDDRGIAGVEGQGRQSQARSGIAATPEFINDLDSKIRRGQISTTRPGMIALHAPFQEVTSESLKLWRDVFKQILDRGKLPKGVHRIEITGGTGPMLAFEQPNWTGLIVY
jgi:hypothetical protein